MTPKFPTPPAPLSSQVDSTSLIESLQMEIAAMPESAVVAPVVEAPAPVLLTALAVPAGRHRGFYASCNWNIMRDPDSSEEGAIIARNNLTGDSYTGNSTDFNAMLRGE